MGFPRSVVTLQLHILTHWHRKSSGVCDLCLGSPSSNCPLWTPSPPEAAFSGSRLQGCWGLQAEGWSRPRGATWVWGGSFPELERAWRSSLYSLELPIKCFSKDFSSRRRVLTWKRSDCCFWLLGRRWEEARGRPHLRPTQPSR